MIQVCVGSFLHIFGVIFNILIVLSCYFSLKILVMILSHRYEHSFNPDFGVAAYDLINIASNHRNVVRLVFWGCAADKTEYFIQYGILRRLLKDVFHDKVPAFTYVAQSLLSPGKLCVEIQSLDGDDVVCQYKVWEDLTYVKADMGSSCMMFLSAGSSNDEYQSVTRLSELVFEKLKTIILGNGFEIADIVRQWNYIERITEIDDKGRQRYQEFNDARSNFYDNAFDIGGYPAATGIGADYGGIQICVDILAAASCESRRVDNPYQRSAHRYSSDVLFGGEGKTTPKFERARAITSFMGQWVYISGTAAIRGEQTCEVDAVCQSRLAMENIQMLLSSQNLSKYGVMGKAHLKSLRVYIKNAEDLSSIRSELEKMVSEIETIYVKAEICRTNLLVEIEGVADICT